MLNFLILTIMFLLVSCGGPLNQGPSSTKDGSPHQDGSKPDPARQRGTDPQRSGRDPSKKTAERNEDTKKTPSKPKKALRLDLDEFACETDINSSYPVIRYLRNNIAITRYKTIQLLADDNPVGTSFRTLWNRCIARLPAPAGANGYMIQAPIIEKSTKDEPFYFVAIPTNLGSFGKLFNDYLVHCDPAPQGALKSAAYKARFIKMFALDQGLGTFLVRDLNSVKPNLPYGAVIFKGGYGVPEPKEIMVSPCPAEDNMDDIKNEFLGHIYAFAKEVDKSGSIESRRRLQSFWYAVGKTAEYMFDGINVKDIDGNPQPALYLNTHGNVPYLHFRVENLPLHYHQVNDLTNGQNSKTYYSKIFP